MFGKKQTVLGKEQTVFGKEQTERRQGGNWRAAAPSAPRTTQPDLAHDSESRDRRETQSYFRSFSPGSVATIFIVSMLTRTTRLSRSTM